MELNTSDLEAILSGDANQLDVHLTLVEKSLPVSGSELRLSCHCLSVDANGRVKVARLVEYLRLVLTDYAIPRTKIESARKRDAEFNSSAAMNALLFEARNLFTNLKNSGEGGEMLLYVLAQHYLKLPQVLCKMDLKTDSKMHYHGADGVYADVTDDGVLKLYWGESKVYATPSAAISACLKSLAPFLSQPESEEAERERDLVLLSDKADLSDPRLTAAFKRYFDKNSSMSNRVRYCGIGLVGFDSTMYPGADGAAVAEKLAAQVKIDVQDWLLQAKKHVDKQKIAHFEIELLCVPLPKVSSFRKEFLRALGVS